MLVEQVAIRVNLARHRLSVQPEPRDQLKLIASVLEPCYIRLIMKYLSTLFLVVLVVISMSSCSKSEEPVAPPPSTDDAAAAKAAAEKAARDAIEADLARARELIVNYAGDPGDLEEAKELLKSVLTRDRDHAPAYIDLARLEIRGAYNGGDDWDRAKMINAGKFVRHAFSLDTELPEGHVLEARVRLALGEFDKAELSLERAEQAGVARETLDMIRARIAAAYDNEREAVRLAREIVESDEASDSLKFEMQTFIGSRLARQGFRVEAQEAYEKAIALGPDRAWGYGNLAAFHLDHGYVEEGLRAAEQAVEIDPYPAGVRTLARASIMRAQQLFDSKRQGEAEKTIEALVRKVPAGNPDVSAQLGDYYYGLFQETNDASYLDRAIESYRSVMSADPERSEVAKALEIAVRRRDDLTSR